MSGIILRIGYSVCSLWTVVCAPDVWGELVPSKILNPSSLTLKVKHLVAILCIFLGIPIFLPIVSTPIFYQIVSTPNFPIFAPFYFFTSQNIYFFTPHFYYPLIFFLYFPRIFYCFFLLFLLWIFMSCMCKC